MLAFTSVINSLNAMVGVSVIQITHKHFNIETYFKQ